MNLTLLMLPNRGPWTGPSTAICLVSGWLLNAVLHRIAVTQIRLDGLGQTDYRKRINAGDSKTEPLRCLKRRLSRVVFHHLHTDHQSRLQPCQPAAA
jgi:transposase